MKTKKVHYAWAILIGAILTTGLVMGFATGGVAALFVVPITSSLEIGRAAYAVNTTIISICGAIMQVTIGKIYTKYRFKKFQSGSILLLALVFLARSFCTNIYQLYVCSFVAGFLTSPVVMANSTMITYWFQKNRGLAVSLVFAGQSLTATIISPIVSRLIQNSGWQMAYRVFAVVLLVVALPIALFVMRQSPEDMGMKPYGYVEGENIQNKKVVGKGASFTVEEVRTKGFFILYLLAAFLAGTVGGNGAQSQLAPAMTDAFDATTAATFVSLSALVAIAAKVLLGIMQDKLGLRPTYIFGFICYMICFSSMLFVPAKGMYYVSLVSYAFVMGVGQVSFTLFASDTFGAKYFSYFFGIHQTVIFLGSSVGSYLAGLIYDMAGAYTILWVAATIISLAALVLYMICNTQAKKCAPKEAAAAE